jgi:hypothetical protein
LNFDRNGTSENINFIYDTLDDEATKFYVEKQIIVGISLDLNNFDVIDNVIFKDVSINSLMHRFKLQYHNTVAQLDDDQVAEEKNIESLRRTL